MTRIGLGHGIAQATQAGITVNSTVYVVLIQDDDALALLFLLSVAPARGMPGSQRDKQHCRYHANTTNMAENIAVLHILINALQEQSVP